MPQATVEPDQWPYFDSLTSGEKPDSDKARAIYKVLLEDMDPLIPTDAWSFPEYSPHVAAILAAARNHSNDGLLAAVVNLISAFRASSSRASPQLGDKRTHVQGDVDDADARNNLEVDEMLSALNADDSSFDLGLASLNGSASSRSGQDRRKRAKLGEELEEKRYVKLNIILGRRDFEELMDKVEEGLTAFIQNHSGSLPLWDPEPVWADCPDVLACLRALKIPLLPREDGVCIPDMLLAALGQDEVSLDDDLGSRIYTLMKGVTTSWNLLNVSGSGKTRLLFEILVKHWGFFFACGLDADRSPYGSRDILTALNIIGSKRPAHYMDTPDLTFDHLSGGDANTVDKLTDQELNSLLDHRATNKHIAEHVFHVVVLARALLFESFLICWQRVKLSKPARRTPGRYQAAFRSKLLRKLCEGNIVDKTAAIRTWAFVQIRPHLVLGGSASSPDAFCLVLDQLQWASPKAVSSANSDIMASLKSNGRVTVAAAMFDEVQYLASFWSNAFGPEEGELEGGGRARARISRPVLKPLTVAVMESLPMNTRSLLAATKFNEFLVREAILSGMAKASSEPQRYIKFGDQGTATKVMTTLMRFFGHQFVSHMDPQLWNDIKFWLTARHRFLMAFIQFVLCRGPTSMPNVLRNIIRRLTGYTTHGAVQIDEISDINCSRLIPFEERIKTRITKHSRIIHCVRLIVYAWAFHGQYPLLPKSDIELVTLGIGRLVPEAGTFSSVDRVDASENMTAAALFNWLNDVEKDESLSMMIDRDLCQLEPSVRGFALENSLVYLFWRAFSVGCRLEDVFNFVYLPPAWRDERVCLVDVVRNYSGTGDSILVSKQLTARLAWRTSTIAGTQAWFKREGMANMRVPFLRPDNMIGPDLFFILRFMTSGVEILVCVQSKAWSSQHGEDELLAEAFKLSPERFYGIKERPKNPKVAKYVAKRQAEMQVLLEDMLLPSSLDMTAPGTTFVAQPEYEYDEKPPKFPILRVFAAYEGSFKLPSTTPGRMGRYPLALLSDKFLGEAQQLLPSMGVAAQAVGANRAKVAAEQLQQQREEEDEEARYAAWAMEEDQLASDLLKLVEESQDSNL